MAKNYWVITRPKRKLLLVPDLLRIFFTIAEGKEWARNRALHIQFEQALTDAQWKAQNVSEDGSGGRTYASLLYMLGLWYEHEQRVLITNVGKEIIEGGPSVELLTKQLLDMQFPSAYSIKAHVDVSREFNIWPFRFVLKLLLDGGLGTISEDEIAFCVIPFARSMSDLEKCCKLILSYRQHAARIQNQAVNASNTTTDNLKNIANTVINQLEYTGLFVESDNLRSLVLAPGNQGSAREKISRARAELLPNPEEGSTFQRRYGSGLEKTKDYSLSTREPMSVSPNERLVLEKFYVMASNQPINVLSDSLIKRISADTGARPSFVERVLQKLPVSIQATQFKETYLKLSVGGVATAADFERKTHVLFLDGFGINSDWTGSRPRNPDIILYVDLVNKLHGIIDTKAYSSYTLSLDQKNKMAYTYVPSFSQIKFNGETYTLAFFAYVAGGYSSTIQKSFQEFRRMTSVPGSYMTARNLLKLLDLHRQNNFSSMRLIEMFSSNNEIVGSELG